MAYYCRECSYSGKKPSAEGKCPACGSANFRRADSKSDEKTRQGSHPLKLLAMVALWGWLIYEIHRKLNAL